MYAPSKPSQVTAEMAMFGLCLEDYSPEQQAKMLASDEIEVWPDNVESVEFFEAVSTQWMLGQGGPIGLRYETFAQVREALLIDPARWPFIFDDVRLMEGEALKTLHEQMKRNDDDGK